MAACNPSLSFTAHPRASSPVCLLAAIRPPSLTIAAFPPGISVVLSHHLSVADRRTDERLSRARSAPFLFFTSGVPGGRSPLSPSPPPSIRAFLSSRPCRNKTAATARIDASRCKFVLFFMARVIPRHLPHLGQHSLLTRDFYLNERRRSLSRIVPRLYCIREKSRASERLGIFILAAKTLPRRSYPPLRFIVVIVNIVIMCEKMSLRSFSKRHTHTHTHVLNTSFLLLFSF